MTKGSRGSVLLAAAAVAVAAGFAVGSLGAVWLLLSMFLLALALFSAAQVARVTVAEDVNGEGERGLLFRSVIVGFAAFFSLLMSVLVPSLQSPDEMAHVARAYTLLENDVVVSNLGSRTNQQLEDGLHLYSQLWGSNLPFKPDARVTPQIESDSRSVRWKGHETPYYNPAAIYFPALYAPAATGIGLARALHQPVWVAVTWSRFGMWAFSVAALILALAIVQSGRRLMCASIILPMTLAQLGSANLDSLTIAGSFLLLAIFNWLFSLKSDRASPLTQSWGWTSAWLLIALLALAKPIFLVFLALPALLIMRRGEWHRAVPAIAILVVVLGWQAHVAGSFSNPNPAITVSPFSRLADALFSPIETGKLLVLTFQVKGEFYWQSMVGILGWLDTPLLAGTYTSAAWLLGLALLSDVMSVRRISGAGRLAFAGTSLSYLLGTMMLLWATWTIVGNSVIEGVQGRYFIPLLPALAMILGGAASLPGRAGKLFQRFITFYFFSYMVFLTVDVPTTLINRFWL